jgi:uncharacterized C2H2 Zn-finger protein
VSDLARSRIARARNIEGVREVAAEIVELLDLPVADAQPTFTCPRCGMTSAHPKDVEQGYCGNCHDWTGQHEVSA